MSASGLPHMGNAEKLPAFHATGVDERGAMAPARELNHKKRAATREQIYNLKYSWRFQSGEEHWLWVYDVNEWAPTQIIRARISQDTSRGQVYFPRSKERVLGLLERRSTGRTVMIIVWGAGVAGFCWLNWLIVAGRAVFVNPIGKLGADRGKEKLAQNKEKMTGGA